MSSLEKRLALLFQQISLTLSVVVGLLGVLVLIGWHFRWHFLTNINTHYVPMMPNTAASFILISLSLLLQQKPASTQKMKAMIAKLLVIPIGVIGLYTLFEIIFHFNVNLDHSFFIDNTHTLIPNDPQHMAAITAVNFIIISLTLILIDKVKQSLIWQSLTFCIGMIGIYILSGYIYEVILSQELVQTAEAALHTAFNFILAAIAILFIRPREGLTALFISNTNGGMLLRFLIPCACIIPTLIGIIISYGADYFDLTITTQATFYSLSNSLIAVILVTYAAQKIFYSDNERDKALNEYARINQELQQFTYAASHDLKEPLRSITNFAQLIERNNADKLDHESQEYLDYIISSAVHLNLLISDVLDYSRIAANINSYTQTDLNYILNDTLKLFSPSIKENNAQITTSHLPVIYCDQIEMRLLFQNLISNAIKFSNKQPQINITCHEDKDSWIFAFADNGIGIPDEASSLIFTPFKRLHTAQKYPGTGIGLAICKKIVEKHDGKIWFESEPGKGSTFYFSVTK